MNTAYFQMSCTQPDAA